MTIRELQVYHAPGLEPTARATARAVGEAFPGLRIRALEPREVPGAAWDAARGQVRADRALDALRGAPVQGLWLLAEDAYVPGMNFVFGLARAGEGAVVATGRLPDEAMVAKEAVHEVGHYLGLGHCPGPCVMEFSNSLAEALRKPARLCARCRARQEASG